MIPYLITTNSIVVVLNDKPYTINNEDANFNAVRALIQKDASAEEILELINKDNIKQAIQEFISDEAGNISFDGYNITCKLYGYDFPLSEVMVNAIISIAKNKLSFKPIYNFIKHLANNGDPEIVDQLFGFMEANGFTIREDGKFLAYKKVASNYKDIYSGKFDNSVGNIVAMPRHGVEKDTHKTCSAGLHVAAWSYLRHYGGSHQDGHSRVMVVSVNPADVVSIPVDYDNAKMRVCRYIVESELELDDELKEQFAIYDRDSYEYDEYEEEIEDTFEYEW